MTTTSDGGPAFRCNDSDAGGYLGMSLRDWFAGQALAGVLAAESDSEGGGIIYSPTLVPFAGPAKMFATMAYGLADAMLAARKPRE